MAIAETAYAKVNLYLHITAIRADGYHELDSLFAFAETGDRLTFDESDHLSLRAIGRFGPHVPETDNNLVLRAAVALQRATGCDKGASITLDKVLPVASGIGGGSADAAAALKGLNRLWRLDLADDVLEEIGESIGADVPACVRSCLSYVSGIGEHLAPARTHHPAWLVLVNPGVSVSTPEVFRRFDVTPDMQPFLGPLASTQSPDWYAELATRQNALQAPAIDLAPEIRDAIDAISSTGHCLLARMSGSGATCFGLFAQEIHARKAADLLGETHPDWWIEATALRTAVEAVP